MDEKCLAAIVLVKAEDADERNACTDGPREAMKTVTIMEGTVRFIESCLPAWNTDTRSVVDNRTFTLRIWVDNTRSTTAIEEDDDVVACFESTACFLYRMVADAVFRFPIFPH